jgi:pimeloyl-ACP methyl ester carboxylesterase
MRFGPPISFARRRDGRNLAYQVVGDGELDLVFLFGFPTSLALIWDNPAFVAGFLQRLSSFSRLIVCERLGTGLSDRGPTGHTFEDWMDDVRCVLAAVGSEQAAFFGCDFGRRLALLLAATYPDQVSAVVTFGSHPTTLRDQDYPWGATPEAREAVLAAGQGRDPGPGRCAGDRGAAGGDRRLGGPVVEAVLPVGHQPGGGLRGAQVARSRADHRPSYVTRNTEIRIDAIGRLFDTSSASCCRRSSRIRSAMRSASSVLAATTLP